MPAKGKRTKPARRVMLLPRGYRSQRRVFKKKQVDDMDPFKLFPRKQPSRLFPPLLREQCNKNVSGEIMQPIFGTPCLCPARWRYFKEPTSIAVVNIRTRMPLAFGNLASNEAWAVSETSVHEDKATAQFEWRVTSGGTHLGGGCIMILKFGSSPPKSSQDFSWSWTALTSDSVLTYRCGCETQLFPLILTLS